MVYILSFLNYVIFAFLKSWSRIQGPNFIILIKLCLSPFSFLHQNTRDLISYKQHKFSSGGWEDEGVGRFCLVRAHFLVHRYGLFFTVSSYSKKGEGALWSLVSKSTNLIHEGSALGTQTLRPQQTQVSSYLPFESGKVFYSDHFTVTGAFPWIISLNSRLSPCLPCLFCSLVIWGEGSNIYLLISLFTCLFIL